ncbi:putative membrane protein YdjX (TVP38/TMEM64 family) [Nocardioides marinisabuli]|uniref:TVP38/TMEM64 family membrane protein n=1 Tax=Nocardioides marinisabuli TaxID=419476 RepID=A0A7Y9EZ63_9ACTN|nr:VTT domain-containing protein [Nocardioides marinisabuli]NYD56672.1 putative membrane protein YdjX (TVP38/TMEM64 family) [Nocardioides marinisabuli]
MNRATVVKAGVLLALVALAVGLQLSVGLPSQAELRSTLDGLGAWAVPAFVAAYAAVSLLPAGPTAVMTVLGGLLLGFGTGLAAVLAAAVLGAVAAFFVSRLLGRDAVRSLTGQRFASLDDRVRDNGFATVLLARLIPLVPFSTANYAFGLTSVSTRSYAGATALGIVPGSAVYVAVGAFGTDPGSPPFLLAIAALVLLTVLGVWRQRRTRGAAPSDADRAPGPG